MWSWRDFVINSMLSIAELASTVSNAGKLMPLQYKIMIAKLNQDQFKGSLYVEWSDHIFVVLVSLGKGYHHNSATGPSLPSQLPVIQSWISTSHSCQFDMCFVWMWVHTLWYYHEGGRRPWVTPVANSLRRSSKSSRHPSLALQAGSHPSAKALTYILSFIPKLEWYETAMEWHWNNLPICQSFWKWLPGTEIPRMGPDCLWTFLHICGYPHWPNVLGTWLLCRSRPLIVQGKYSPHPHPHPHPTPSCTEYRVESMFIIVS